MKNKTGFILAAALILAMTGCGNTPSSETPAVTTSAAETTVKETEAKAEEEKATEKKADDDSSKQETKKAKKKKKKTSNDPSKQEEKQNSSAKEKEIEPAASSEQQKSEASGNDGSAKSEAEKYMNDLRTAFKAYSKPLTSTYLEASESGDFETARKAIDESAAGLDEIENISVPEKYAELHSELLKTLSGERDALEFMRRFNDCSEKYNELKAKSSPTEEDMKDAQELISEINSLNKEMNSSSSGFAQEYLELIKTVKADIDG